jgi:hypothetical protein
MLRTLLAICAALAVLPAAAHGAQGSTRMWATVNVCDTAARPDTIGIRGSMPGLKRTATLRMRFRVQYLAPDGRWLNIRRNADSGWQTVGRRHGGRVESGWSFTFAPPKAGGEIVLRGLVNFQWWRSGKLVRRARRITEGGHVSPVGADPPGFSAGTCRIS